MWIAMSLTFLVVNHLPLVGKSFGREATGIFLAGTFIMLLGAIDDWELEKLAKQSTTAADLAACMRVFASHGENLGQAIRYAETLFAQTSGQLLFSTGHKAKGLEFPYVIHLDPFLLSETEQDKNLSYVISTRSSEQLYTVNSNDVVVR